MSITGAVLVGHKALRKNMALLALHERVETSIIFHAQAVRFNEELMKAAPTVVKQKPGSIHPGRYKMNTASRNKMKGAVGSFVRIDYQLSPLATAFEYGKGKIAAQSYFRNTWEKMRSKMRAKITRDLKKLVRKQAKKVNNAVAQELDIRGVARRD